jgi:hypothetical protein
MKAVTLFPSIRSTNPLLKPARNTWRRLFIITTVIALAASAAFAARPSVQIVPAGPGVLPSGISGCAFDIGFAPASNKEKLTTFFDQNGNVRLMMITGERKETLVNLISGKSITLNISGPARIQQNQDGTLQVTGAGPAIGIFGPSVAPGFPTNAYTTGRLVVLTDQDLNPIQVLSSTGTVTDVCALLS